MVSPVRAPRPRRRETRRMFQRALARLFAAPDSPTADLYFLNACGDFLNAGVRQLGPTVFAGAGGCLVMRHDLHAGALPGGRVIYFVDDAVEEGAGDASLPFIYRQKLRLVERAAGRRVCGRAATVVVSSPALARRFAAVAETRLVHPYWSGLPADPGHHDALADGRDWIDVAYLGSAVHRSDLAFLWPVVEDLLSAHRRMRFHLSERHRVPAALARHPRIVRIPARGWSIYRAAMRGRRFHLALYPLMDSPFNRARSLNKLIEHGLVGAAPVYSRCWPEAWRAEAAGAGLVLDNRPDDWRAAIESLVARPEGMRALAMRAGNLARTLNQPGPQRQLWAELMEVRLDAAA